jgi:hypothetical protein
VDKTGFVYRLKGLRMPGWAGKALYPACTDVGQKPGEQKIRCFCTCGAVDMQGFFHNRPEKRRFSCLNGKFGSADCLADRTVFLVLQLIDFFFCRQDKVGRPAAWRSASLAASLF